MGMRIALYKGKRGGFAGAFDAAVRWWTRGAYSHVELIFSDGMSASASSRDGGVRFKRIDFNPEHWDFVELKVNEEQLRASVLKSLEQNEAERRIEDIAARAFIAEEYERAVIAYRLGQGFDEEEARAFFEKREGLGYDYFGLFGFVWRPHNGISRRWFCSEAVAAALGIPDPWRFCPNTLAAVAMSPLKKSTSLPRR